VLQTLNRKKGRRDAECARLQMAHFLVRERLAWHRLPGTTPQLVRAQARQGALTPPLLCFATATGEIAPPLRYTNAPPRRVRQPSHAIVRVRTRPWRRGCARKVPRASPLHRRLIWPCEYALGSVASPPSPSIVAATGARSYNPPLDLWRLAFSGLRRSGNDLFFRRHYCCKINA